MNTARAYPLPRPSTQLSERQDRMRELLDDAIAGRQMPLVKDKCCPDLIRRNFGTDLQGFLCFLYDSYVRRGCVDTVMLTFPDGTRRNVRLDMKDRLLTITFCG